MPSNVFAQNDKLAIRREQAGRMNASRFSQMWFGSPATCLEAKPTRMTAPEAGMR
jgi:hypothetical protein